MPVAIFRFHAELNEFLPKKKRRLEIEVAFKGHETVKHLLESLGVPHTEVDFSTRLDDGDRVDIYPRSEMLEVVPVIRLQPEALDEPRFVLDGHLGRLASYLRLLGFDALYRNDYDDDALAEISSNQDRNLTDA